MLEDAVRAEFFIKKNSQNNVSGHAIYYMTRINFKCFWSCNSFNGTNSGQKEFHEVQKSGNICSGHVTHYNHVRPVFWCGWYSISWNE